MSAKRGNDCVTAAGAGVRTTARARIVYHVSHHAYYHFIKSAGEALSLTGLRILRQNYFQNKSF
jgi:hypothetical protein